MESNNLRSFLIYFALVTSSGSGASTAPNLCSSVDAVGEIGLVPYVQAILERSIYTAKSGRLDEAFQGLKDQISQILGIRFRNATMVAGYDGLNILPIRHVLKIEILNEMVEFEKPFIQRFEKFGYVAMYRANKIYLPSFSIDTGKGTFDIFDHQLDSSLVESNLDLLNKARQTYFRMLHEECFHAIQERRRFDQQFPLTTRMFDSRLKAHVNSGMGEKFVFDETEYAEFLTTRVDQSVFNFFFPTQRHFDIFFRSYPPRATFLRVLAEENALPSFVKAFADNLIQGLDQPPPPQRDNFPSADL